MHSPATALNRTLSALLAQSRLSFAKMPPKRKLLAESQNSENGAKKSKDSNGSALTVAVAPEVVEAQNQCHDAPTLKLMSWNVNGVRAWLKKKDCLDILTLEKPDMLMIQETKCGSKDLPQEIKQVTGYHSYFQSTSGANGGNEGYAGVGLFSLTKPLNVTFGLDNEEHDKEGRIITAEYEKFFLVGAYVPNAGRGLVRLKYRRGWNKDFLAYIKKLDEQKPVIYTGDLNVAHKEIDLANPKANRNKTAGFTDEERADFDELLAAGFTDSFRHLYPTKKNAYTFWTYMGNARAKNVGWRLDYFLLSNRINDKICETRILSNVMGSDHCPIEIKLAL